MTIREPKQIAIVIRGLRNADQRLMERAGKGLARALEYVVTKSQLEYFRPSRAAGDASKLVAVSGRLRKSIVSKVVTGKGWVRGTIGTNVSYGAYHEFGFHGVQQVKAHTRVARILKNGKAVDYRRVYKRKDGEVLGFREGMGRSAARLGLFTRPEFAVSVQQVRAHSRRVDYYGRPFIRPALLLSREMIVEEIQAAMWAK